MEYSTAKQGQDPDYLHSMVRRGFQIFLLDCYPKLGTDENKIIAAMGNGVAGRCLNMHNFQHFNRSALQSAVYVDVPIAPEVTRFLRCLVGSASVVSTDPCARLLEQQRVTALDEFRIAVGEGEVDLILRLEPKL